MSTQIRYRKGEAAPLYGTASPSSGTLTVSGTPTFTLARLWGDRAGSAVINGTAVTSYGTVSGAIQAYYTLDTSQLDAGDYVAYFSITVTASDSVQRTLRPGTTVEVFTTNS